MISASRSNLREPQKSRTPRFQEGLNSVSARLEETAMRNSWTRREPSGRSGDGVSVSSGTCRIYCLHICSSRQLWFSFTVDCLSHIYSQYFLFLTFFSYWRLIALQKFVVFLKHPCAHRFCFLSRSACSWLLTASASLQSLPLLHKLNSSHCKLPLLSMFLNSNSWNLDSWS